MTAMSRIAESAHSVKAPRNKSMAFDAVRAIIRTLTEEQERELHGDLARLYASFMPAAPKKPKTVFDWVAKGMGTTDVRYYLNYVYVTETRMVGTDGHRLHVAPNTDGLEPGFYDKAGTKIHGLDYARYPDIDRVMPSDLNGNGRKIIEATVGELQVGTLEQKKKLYHYYRFPVKDDLFTAVDATYLNDAVSMEDADTVLHWSIGEANQVVGIANLSGGRKACIMPMRV